MEASIFISGLFHLPIVCEAITASGLTPVVHSSYPSFKLKQRLNNHCQLHSYTRKELISKLPGVLFKDKPLTLSQVFQNDIKKALDKLDSELAIGWAGHSLALLKVSKERGIPVILERGSTHICWQKEMLIKAYNSAGIRPNMKLIPTEAYIESEMIEYEKASIIHVPSQFCADSFSHYMKKTKQKNIRVTRYGFNFSSPTEAVQNKHPKKIINIGFAGTLSVRKGFFDCCWLASKIDCKHTLFEAVGKQDEDTKTILKLYKTPIQPEPSLSRAALLQRLERWDILVLPSYEEGLAMIIPEALSRNTVVIASDVSGATEYINHGKTGLIFEHGNREQLRSAIEMLIETPEKIIDIQSRLHENNQKNHDADLYFNEYSNSVNELLGKTHSNEKT